MNIYLEIFGIIAYIPFFLRWVLQLHASKKAKRSVTPKGFWILTIIAMILIATYTFLLGSLIFPIMTIIATIFQLYISRENIKIENKRTETT